MSQIKCAIKLNMFIYLKLEIQFLWKNIKAGESKEKQKKPSFALLYSQSWLGENSCDHVNEIYFVKLNRVLT